MNSRLCHGLWFSLICLVGCSSSGSSSAPRTAQISSADLLSELSELTPGEQRALFSSVASLSIPNYFAIMLANASDAPVAIDGTMFSLAKTQLLAQAPTYAALAKSYASIGALRSANGEASGMPTLAAVRAGLRSISPSLGLVGFTTLACQPPVAKTWTAVPPNAKSIAGKNAIEYAGVNYSQVGVALKRYQTEADRLKIGWDEWMGRGNLAVQTNDTFGRPVIVTGHPSAVGPATVKAVGSDGRPSTDITGPAFDCYQQTAAD